MKLSDAMIDRLNELGMPNNIAMSRVLALLYKHPNNFLFVRDLPNGMKEVDVIQFQPPSSSQGTNGTNPSSSK